MEEIQKHPIKKLLEDIQITASQPVARNALIAASLRCFGGMTVSSFLPVYFGRNFPGFKAEYAVLNGLGLSSFGLLSTLLAGIIADKYSARYPMTKALLGFQGCLISPFLIALCCLSGNFYLAVLCYALKVLFSATYSGPAITMI